MDSGLAWEHQRTLSYSTSRVGQEVPCVTYKYPKVLTYPLGPPQMSSGRVPNKIIGTTTPLYVKKCSVKAFAISP